MLTLDQVRLLENRVGKAVGRISSLTEENTLLKNKLSEFQNRINELESLVGSFKDDQGRIEEGILNALDRLSAFEDSFLSSQTSEDSVDLPLVDNSESFSDTDESSTVTSKDNFLETSEDFKDDILEATWDEPTQDVPHSNSSSPDGQMDIF